MRRKTYTADSSQLSEVTTDETLQQFSDYVDKINPTLRSSETEDRYALFLNATTIEIFCTTKREFIAYRFALENGQYVYKGNQGDFRV